MTEHPLSPYHGQVPADPSRPPPPRADDPGWVTQEGEDGGFDWRRYASALLRFRWIVVVAVLLGTGATYLFWKRVREAPEYVSYGSLWLQPGAGDQGPIVTEGLLQTTSWVDLLRSYSVLDSVVMQQRLYLVPATPGDLELFDRFQLGEQPVPGAYRIRVSEDGRQVVLQRNRVEVGRAAQGGRLGGGQGFIWTLPPRLAPGREVAFTVMTPRDAATVLRDQLTAQIDQRGSFIRLGLRGRDPERLAGVVNGVMERHVALAAELKRGHLDEQTEILERQLRLAEAELRDAERTLEDFRVRTITLPSEETAIQPGLEMTRGPVFQDFFQMRVEQEQLRRDRQRLEQVLEELPDSEFRIEAVELIPSVGSSSQLREVLASLVQARIEYRSLLQRYTAEHPLAREVADRIANFETNAIPALLAQLVRELRSEEDRLAARIASSGGDLSEIPPRAIEEARLRRRVAIAENLYTQLRGRYETSNLARASSLPDVRILDRAAVSRVPATDRRAGMAVVLFVGFLGAGLAGALMADRLDPRVRTPDEVSNVLGLTVLGIVPRIRGGNGRNGSGNMDQAREAFRGLRTNLEFAYGSAGPIVVTISSPGMEEGKTLVTSNLALCFAELGRRTVVIDGDTRRGNLHHALEGERKPGLTDFLASTSPPDRFIQPTAHPHLHFIGCGTQVANSPELLSSPRIGELLSELRKRYDVILFDSPPLGVGADALVLACLAANMVLLFRSESTHREYAQAKLEPLGRLPVRLLGAVLNDFKPDRLSSPFYHRYYGNYLPGYETGTEEPELELEKEPV